MSWSDPMMLYCERLDRAFWAEPLNALSNAAFLVAAAAAFMQWRRASRNDYAVLGLILVAAAIGFGSFAFHTIATRLASLFDVLPIFVFAIGYFYLALRRFLRLGAGIAAGVTLIFLCVAIFFEARIEGLNGSAAYVPMLLAMLVLAAALRRDSGGDARENQRRRLAARGLLDAAQVFALSLLFRTVDRAICPLVPIGAHFVWHMLNAVVVWLLLQTALRAEAEAA